MPPGRVTPGLIETSAKVPPRTPAKAGAQLGNVGKVRGSLPNWTPAFAGVRQFSGD